MNYRILETDSASADMKLIVEYISGHLGSPNAALDLLVEYKDKLNQLKTNPRIFPAMKVKALANKGYRKILFGNYLASYLVDDAANAVIVVRIFHQIQRYIDVL